MKEIKRKWDFLIDRLLSGGVMINYFCISSCCHCLYFCSSKWQKEYMQRGILPQILEKIRRLGCSSIHIGGGELHEILHQFVLYYRTAGTSNAGKGAHAFEHNACHFMLTAVNLINKPSSCNRMTMACLETLENPPASHMAAAMKGQCSIQGST